MNEDELQKSLKALGTHLIEKGDKKGIMLYQTLIDDIIAYQEETAGLVRQMNKGGEAVG